MAHHYPLKETTEKEVFKTCKSIVKQINRKWHEIKERKIYNIEGKNVQRLPIQHNPAGRAILVNSFTLKGKIWDERKIGGEDFRKNVYLEVHFSEKEKISGIYYPL